MRRCRKGDKQEKPKSLHAPQFRAMKEQKVKRKDGKPGKNVRQQRAGEHRQCGEEREAGNNDGQTPRPSAKPHHAQYQPNHPNGASGLQDEFGPEVKSLPEVDKQAEYGRPAGYEIPLVPAGEIAAGSYSSSG